MVTLPRPGCLSFLKCSRLTFYPLPNLSLPDVSSFVVLTALALFSVVMGGGSFVLSLLFALLCHHELLSPDVVSGVRYEWVAG